MSELTTVAPFTLPAKPKRRYLRTIIARSMALAENLFDRQREREQLILSRYAGCSWGDATERRINADIAKCNWTRF